MRQTSVAHMRKMDVAAGLRRKTTTRVCVVVSDANNFIPDPLASSPVLNAPPRGLQRLIRVSNVRCVMRKRLWTEGAHPVVHSRPKWVRWKRLVKGNSGAERQVLCVNSPIDCNRAFAQNFG